MILYGPTRKASWHPSLLSRETVQDSYSDPISLVRESVIVSVLGTVDLGSLSHLSTVEQLQARANYFSYRIHGEGKNLVGDNLFRLLG